MKQNTLSEIKKTEQQAKEIVNEAGQKSVNLVSQAQEQGKKNLANAENLVGTQINEIINRAKKEVQSLKAKQERDSGNEIRKLNEIDAKTLNQAARFIVDKITKS